MSGLPSDCYQRTVSRIDGVDCHAVVTVVGTVYEASIGRHRDFRGGAVPRKRRRKRDDLTRENITQQTAHLTLDLPLLLPGIHVHTTPTDFFPLKQMHLQRFEGRQWVLFGDVIGG